MKWYFSSLALLILFAGALRAQNLVTRHNLELGGGGLFPLDGYKASEYSPGPDLHLGYELRLERHFAAEAGWTGAWAPGTSCSRLGCTHPRVGLKLLDYGLRGVMPIAAERVELSVGLGGGYIWYSHESGDYYYSSPLIQYSGKVTVAVDTRKRVRLGFTVRAWRDLGRPIQQWLSTTASITYGFGGRR